ncbi:MAG TPA: hypothetical protein DD491_12355 [Halieaceae bacterium]|nr:hypothetical protein [Halieaceae bacterium]
MSSPGFRLALDAQSDEIVHIDDVAAGYAHCLCPDPGCRAPVQACNLNPETRQVASYFRHASRDTPCGEETALHQYAKALIARAPTLALPAFKAAVSYYPPNGQERTKDFHKGAVTVGNHGGRTEVSLKVADRTVRPDVLMDCSDGHQVAIEVHVAHRVEEEKRELLETLGLETVEVSLRSHLLNHALKTRKDLDDFILKQAARRWIVCHRYDDEMEAFRESVAAASRRPAPALPSRTWPKGGSARYLHGPKDARKDRVNAARDFLAAYRVPAIRERARQALREDFHAGGGPGALTRGLYGELLEAHGGVPPELDVSVPDALAFRSYHPVWQHAVWEALQASPWPVDIRSLVTHARQSSALQRLTDLGLSLAHVEDHCEVLPPGAVPELPPADLAMIPLPARAVRQYCEELADQGILERRRDRYVLPERATSSADR